MTVTALPVTTFVIILGIFDLVVVVYGYCRGRDIAFSVSRFMQWLPRRATFFVCVCFYVMGHFWGFMDCPKCETANLQPIPDTVLPPEPLTEPIQVMPRQP